MLPVIFGLVSGVVSGLGMGGGTILILLLSIFMNMEQHLAQATNLIFFIPTSLVAIWVNIKQKNVDIKVVSVIAIAGMVGAVIGAILAGKMDSTILRKLFAIFILVIGIRECYQIYKEYRKKKQTKV